MTSCAKIQEAYKKFMKNAYYKTCGFQIFSPKYNSIFNKLVEIPLWELWKKCLSFQNFIDFQNVYLRLYTFNIIAYILLKNLWKSVELIYWQILCQVLYIHISTSRSNCWDNVHLIPILLWDLRLVETNGHSLPMRGKAGILLLVWSSPSCEMASVWPFLMVAAQVVFGRVSSAW